MESQASKGFLETKGQAAGERNACVAKFSSVRPEGLKLGE